MRNTEYQVWSPRPAQLVTLDGDHLVTDSRIVANAFGKQHRNVVRIIDEMRASPNEEIASHATLNFERCIFDYKAGRGSVRKMPGYRMTKDGLTELAMGFTGDSARVCRIRFIAAFNSMAEMIANREKNVLQQIHELTKKETVSEVKATFGSRLMLTRKKEIKPLREQRAQLEAMIQPSLIN